LACIKVWGPKKEEKCARIPLTGATPSFPAASEISLVYDTELSAQELYYLRIVHQSAWRASGISMMEILLQNIFNAYGATFSDKSLLYGALIYGRRQVLLDESLRTGDLIEPDQDVTYLELMSKFNESLLAAIQNKNVSECLLFGIFLVLVTRRSRNTKFEVEHKKGFAMILKGLIHQTSGPGLPMDQDHRLFYVYPFLLSLLRRMDPFSFDSRRVSQDLNDIAEELPWPTVVPDNRVAYFFPVQYWEKLGVEPSWFGLYITLLETVATMRSCFQRLVQPQAGLKRQVIQSLSLVQQRLTAMSRVPRVELLLRRVYSLPFCTD
jgi:hypothetical protein